MNNGAFMNSKTLFQFPFSHISPIHSIKTHQFSFSIQPPKHKLLPFNVKIPSGPPVFASKSTEKGETSVLGTEEFDFEDEFDDDFEDEDVEDEEIFIPLRNMKQWTRNKPKGFGEGKVYDTSIEDKLMEELKQSRDAQVVNVNNLKNNPEEGNPKSKKGKVPKQKALEVPPDGVRVRLANLPKKKNIHRDLQASFKPLSGITNIIPAVSGNEKTREPVCKGFAFVDFKSEKDAKRFVDTFSMQPITFGKVQKQIRCEIMKSRSPNPTSVKPSTDVIHRTENPPLVFNLNESFYSNSPTETPSDLDVEDVPFNQLENIDDDVIVSTSDDYNYENFDDVVQGKHEHEIGLESLKTEKKVKEKGKKTMTTKRKTENTSKLNIPGSANSLKMKDKALLSGVFSRYGGKSSMAAKGTDVISD